MRLPALGCVPAVLPDSATWVTVLRWNVPGPALFRSTRYTACLIPFTLRMRYVTTGVAVHLLRSLWCYCCAAPLRITFALRSGLRFVRVTFCVGLLCRCRVAAFMLPHARHTTAHRTRCNGTPAFYGFTCAAPCRCRSFHTLRLDTRCRLQFATVCHRYRVSYAFCVPFVLRCHAVACRLCRDFVRSAGFCLPGFSLQILSRAGSAADLPRVLVTTLRA
jgi:hypothetical protein